MKPISRKSAIALFLLVFMSLVFVARFTVEDNKYNASLQTETIVVEPTKVTVLGVATDEYCLTFERVDETNNTLLFYTNHQEVFIYIEDELVYSVEKDNSIFGRTPGAIWNMVSLPIDTSEVRIVTRQAYPNLSEQAIEFRLGNAINMQKSVVVGSILDVCICLSIFLIGVALLASWMMIFRKTDQQKDILYLGMFAMVFGLWAFGETRVAVSMLDNRSFWSYLAFTCLMTMCLPFLYFIREFLETEDKHAHKLIAGYIVIETIVAQFLHLTGIAGVKETVMFTMANIIFTMLYLFYGIVAAIRRKKNKRKIIANILGLFALLVTAVVDMGGYFVNVSESNQLGKLGFLIYAIILGTETARTAQEKMQEAHKMEIYREMAEKDMPTGCYNRNAYSEDTSIGMELTGVQIITFDLNNLKLCNDTKGHMAGDKYIADAAHMIQEVFAGLGKVYRIGGDEFCIVSKGIAENTILERREALKRAVSEYQKKNANDGFGIACGYATYDPDVDKDIEETRHRADIFMYQDKNKIKGFGREQ